MKLLKAKSDEIVFKYSSDTIVTITKEGIIVSDIVAQTALDRLAVTVEDAPESVKEEITEIVPEVETGPSKEAVIDPAPPVDEDEEITE